MVSPERIAKVAGELSKRLVLHGVKLSTDGSAVLLTEDGLMRLTPEGDSIYEKW
jgi:hypothetical protein